MLHVPFDELPTGGRQDLLAAEPRRRVDQRHCILQLISESDRSARMIESRPSPDPAAQCLIEQSSIEHEVDRQIGGPYLNGLEQLILPGASHLQRLLNLACSLESPQQA